MKIKIIILFATLFIIPRAFAEPEIKGTPTELAKYLPGLPGSVTIQGEGRVRVQADRAVVTLCVSNENRTLSEALKRNDALRTELAQRLTQRGIMADRIKSLKFSSNPEHSFFSGKVKSFKVENLVLVTVDSDTQFLAVADAIENRDEYQYRSMEAQHSQKEEQRIKALTQASQDALKRKEALESTFKVKLSPRDISTASGTGEVIQNRVVNYTSNYASASKAKGLTPVTGLGSMNESIAEGASFGELIYTATISVEFELRKE